MYTSNYTTPTTKITIIPTFGTPTNSMDQRSTTKFLSTIFTITLLIFTPDTKDINIPPITHNNTYQEIILRLHTLTSEFNTSPFSLAQQQQQKNVKSKQFTLYSSSFSSTTSTSNTLSPIKSTNFHDYTFSQDNSSTLPQKLPLSSNISTSPPLISTNNLPNYETFKTNTPTTKFKNIPVKSPTSITVATSRNDNYFACKSEERRNNLTFEMK